MNAGTMRSTVPSQVAGKLSIAQDESWEFATAICCVSADGSPLDLEIIFRCQNLQDSWTTDMAGVSKDSLSGVPPNGWADNLKDLAWLEKAVLLKKKATNDTDSSRKLCLLVFDGHISHVN